MPSHEPVAPEHAVLGLSQKAMRACCLTKCFTGILLLATISKPFVANKLLQAHNRAFHDLATSYNLFELAGEQSGALVLSIAENNLGAAGRITFFWLDVLSICRSGDRTTTTGS